MVPVVPTAIDCIDIHQQVADLVSNFQVFSGGHPGPGLAEMEMANEEKQITELLYDLK